MINKYRQRLNFFVNRLDGFLLPESKEIIKDQTSSIIKLPANRRTAGKWKFEISPYFPVKFYPFQLNGNTVQVDFSCSIDGEIPPSRIRINQEKIYIENYTILIRLWSLEESLSFREDYDSEKIKQDVRDNNNERVILRFHIDKKKKGTETEEPLYHMNFGGIQSGNEISWFPKSINVPRFYFSPMDIILATEFILMNFYSAETFELREDPEWKSIITTAQELFLKPCIENYSSFINDNTNTFLKHTINWN
jgi:hypothetical protein